MKKLVCLQNILVSNSRKGAGEIIDVSEETAASLIKQGLAAELKNTDKLTAEDSSVTEEKETPVFPKRKGPGRPRKK